MNSTRSRSSLGGPGRPAEDFHFNYAVLCRLTGMKRNTVYQHHVRGHYDPRRLETVLVWLARYGRRDLRLKIIEAAMDL